MVFRIILIIFCTQLAQVQADSDHNKWKVKENIINIERFILLNKNDSALFLIQEISKDSNSLYIDLLDQWSKGDNRNNKSILNIYDHLINTLEFRGDILDDFIERNHIIPSHDNFEIDTSFVNLKFKHIDLLFDIGKINKSDSIYQFIDQYLNKLEQNNPNTSLDQFRFQQNRYLLTLAYIAKDTEEYKRILDKNVYIANKHKSSYYIISNFKDQLEYLYLKQDLEGSILIAEDLMTYHINNDSNSIEYYDHHFKLIDLLIFKSQRNPSSELENRIYTLLIKVYNSPYYEIQKLSLSYFIQYFHSFSYSSELGKRILQLYQVKDLPQLCRILLKQINNEGNKVRRTVDYNIISKALEKNGYFKEAIHIIKELNTIQKERYTKELANSLSSFKIQQEKERNEHNLLLEKSKQKYYLLIVIVLIIVLAILFWARKQQKIKNKLLSKKEQEKTLLLKEIHHRVKNNFQIAIGLLDLQFKDVQDIKTLDLLDEWKSKIKSMIIVHQNLYQNDSLEVDLNGYLHQIIYDIKFIYSSIHCESKIETKADYKLDIDTAVNLGLILNELANNAYKYGTKNNKLTINIKCSLKNDQLLIHFYDQGNGIENIEQILEKNTFGIQLLQQLSKQLNGELNFENNNGAHFYIRIQSTT